MKHNPCKLCRSPFHTAFKCPLKKKIPLQKESKKAKEKRTDTFHYWLRKNLPDENGEWTCYLQISSMCPIKVNKHTLQLEHINSKKKRPDLRYNIHNILPACSWCNYMKGSKSLDQLVKIWPHLVKYQSLARKL